MSFARLQNKINELNNPTVAGLDPALEHIPPQILKKHISQRGETLEAAALAVIEFNMGLIDALCGIVPAVKPQSAYYEALGPQGAAALKATCEFARSRGMYVILDGKRGDIGSTAEAYSAAYLGSVKVGDTEIMPYNADALTVNAYLGSDGIKPFIETAVKYDKAIFALVKTSNPSAGELQDKMVQHGDSPSDTSVPLYTAAGDLIEEISHDTVDECGYTRAGAVTGATYPEEMAFLRNRYSNMFFLVPGYGAQGGTAKDAAAAFLDGGRGAIINSSRAIIAAWKKTGKNGTDYTGAACEEAIKMRDEINRMLGK